MLININVFLYSNSIYASVSTNPIATSTTNEYPEATTKQPEGRMLDRETKAPRKQHAEQRDTLYIVPGMSNHLLYRMLSILNFSRMIPKSKFRLIFITVYYTI